MENEMLKNEFIEKSKLVHGNKYDYSKVDYKGCYEEVCIICPIHGEFWQSPMVHVRGGGCQFCSNNHKLSTEEFIEKAKKVHGDKYDYSKVEYTNATTKVCIICPIHGEFWQIPYSHLKGIGCSKCSGKGKLTTEEFIEKAKKIHGDKYDYSKVEYVNNSTKVCIICKDHGEFWQTPDKHINRKHGCPKCGGSLKLTTEEFIAKAKKVHGDKYDYSKVEYINKTKKVCIICPTHGEFWQTAGEHISGNGCPHCKQSKIENEVYNKLTEESIEFIPQFIYDENNQRSKLDFFLPKYNIAIECQGIQHFKPTDFAGKGKKFAKDLFEDNVKRDFNKKMVCENNKYKILYYTKFNVSDYFENHQMLEQIYNKNVYTNLDDILLEIKKR